MRDILLYWSHICVLHRQEKIFLEDLCNTLKEDKINLKIEFFGIGYPFHMAEYLAQKNAVIPDIIVSTDLEVFEDERIYAKFKDSLYDAGDFISLRQSPILELVKRDEKLLPFVAIPFVYYTRNPDKANKTNIDEWTGLAFGGINNSAVKTIIKTVWENYGEMAARNYLKNNKIFNMPIEAFNAVRTDAAETCLVPSLYALRADNIDTFLCKPKEGPLLMPSYLCVNKSIDEDTAKYITGKIMNEDICKFYVDNGDLITFPDRNQKNSRQFGNTALTPSYAFLNELKASYFYDLYCDLLPTARRMTIVE